MFTIDLKGTEIKWFDFPPKFNRKKPAEKSLSKNCPPDNSLKRKSFLRDTKYG